MREEVEVEKGPQRPRRGSERVTVSGERDPSRDSSGLAVEYIYETVLM